MTANNRPPPVTGEFRKQIVGVFVMARLIHLVTAGQAIVSLVMFNGWLLDTLAN